MLKQNKNLKTNTNHRKLFHNKYILKASCQNFLIVIKMLSNNKLGADVNANLLKKKLSKFRLHRRLIRVKKNALAIKYIKTVFNSVYSPRYIEYLKLLIYQRKLGHLKLLRKRLSRLIKLKKLKVAKRLRKYLLNKGLLKKTIFYIITVRIRRNNVFCTITKRDKKLILLFARSAGLYKVKLSKKTFRFKIRYFLNKFFNDVRKHVKPKTELARYSRLSQLQYKKRRNKISKKQNWKQKLAYVSKVCLYAKIVAPKRMRKPLIIRFLRLYKTNRYVRTVVLNVLEKKIFNGCRPKKKRRKKRQGLRVFK